MRIRSRKWGPPVPVGVQDVVDCILRTPLALYAVATIPAAMVLLAVGLQPFVPIGHLTRDAMAVARETGLAHATYGLVSTLGIMAWSISVGAAATGAVIARRARTEGRYAAFMAVGAGIAAMLVLDDAFMIHESPRLAAIGGERTIVALHCAAVLAYLTAFRTLIVRRTDGGLLVLALGLFAASAGIDALNVDAPMESLYWVLEDGAKFMGIAAWATYQIAAAAGAAGLATATGDAGRPGPYRLFP